MGLWWWHEQKGERDAKCGNVPNAEEADPCHFGMGRETGFPWCAVVPEAANLVAPRASHIGR